MNKPNKEQLKRFLYDIITPDTNEETEKFKESIDDFIEISKRMESMSEEELIKEINTQLSPYNLKIDAGL